MGSPLISCIMLTADRPEFVERSIESFLAQTYPNRELVIYDSGQESVPIQDIEGVGYYNGEGATVGQLRNLAIGRSAGKIIAHWDDDDWSHPRRLSEQYELLDAHQCDVTGYSSMVFHHQPKDQWWLYRGELDTALGTSMMYRRTVWENSKFYPVDVGEDNAFQHPGTSHLQDRLTMGQKISKHVVTAFGHNPIRMIATHHGKNISGERGKFIQGNRLNETNWKLITDASRISEIEELLNFQAV